MTCAHAWAPQSTVALYRCLRCKVYGTKPKLRTEIRGGTDVAPIPCQKCDAGAVILWGLTRDGHSKRMPRCDAHRGRGQEKATQ